MNVNTPEQLEYDHVVLTEALVGLAGTDYVSNETRPVMRPFILQDLHYKQSCLISELLQPSLSLRSHQ